MSDYIIGVDLGQANDYTAVTILQRTIRETGRMVDRLAAEAFGGVYHRKVEQLEGVYQARHLERLPLRTPYPEQVKRVTSIMNDVKNLPDVLYRDATYSLVVDQTGVGRPVVDMLRQAGHYLTAVTIHGGDRASHEDGSWRVPKRELVSVLQVLLQSKRLHVAAALSEAATLTKEMLAFKVTISSAGHDSYGNDWRENPHDDMVLSIALAAWAGERLPGRVDAAHADSW